jgi:hypothetical protein
LVSFSSRYDDTFDPQKTRPQGFRCRNLTARGMPPEVVNVGGIPAERQVTASKRETPRERNSPGAAITWRQDTVGLCSVTAPSRSAARGVPVKGDGIPPPPPVSPPYR